MVFPFVRIFLSGAAVLVAPLFLSGSAMAEEVIHNYEVIADVRTDGTVDITEKVTVQAEGREINHGIYRDIPTEYVDLNGRPFHMPFQLESVWRDNQKEPYHVAPQNNGQRIYIGNKDKYVPFGTHIYSIQYRVGRVIGFFPTGDEFYWNVTGNGWIFPIEKASIIVKFPNNTNILKTIGYTGVQGSREGNYKGRVYGPNFSAETTRRLNPHEGFTIAASIPSGIIQKETTFQRIKYFFEENSLWLIWLSFAFMSLAYLFQAWVQHGRDSKGVVVPRFDVPEKMEPDLLRYIHRQAYDTKTFTTLIVYAASKNQIKIEEEQRSTTFVLTGYKKDDAYRIENYNVLTSAFSGMGSLVLPKKGFFGLGPKVDKDVALNLWNAQQTHEKYMVEDSRPYIDRNTKYVAYGIFIGILGTIWAFFLTMNDDQKFFVMFGSVIFYTLVFKLFGKIMPQYTAQGQDLFDHAEGLKMYMKTAERERMNVLYPKNMTPEIFEKLLPYAIALDVEQEWCDYIDALVKDGSIPPQSEWRSGYGYHYHHYGALNESLQALSLTISSATVAPGRSSGFGGGGSGGGGGGGGGGGW